MVTVERLWEVVCEEGRVARRELDRYRWLIGDLALEVETAWGEARVAEFAREINLAKQTVYRYRQMSAFYSVSARRQMLEEYDGDVITHTHYREAMKAGDLETALDMIELAASNCWSTDELARNMGSPEPLRTYICRDYEASCKVSWAEGKLIITVQMAEDIYYTPENIEHIKVTAWKE